MLEYLFSLGIIFCVFIVWNQENDEKKQNLVIVWGITMDAYKTYPKPKCMKNESKMWKYNNF